MFHMRSPRTPAPGLQGRSQHGKRRWAPPGGRGRAPTPSEATAPPKRHVDDSSDRPTPGNSVPLSADMRFAARISGVLCQCLLDTGSNISVINQDVLDMLPNAPKIRKTAVRAKTASQEELPLLGRVALCFHIGGMPVNIAVYVSDRIDVPCLLGLDFLQACPCVVDIRSRKLVLAPSASVRSVSAEAVSVGRLVTSSDVIVPPCAEIVVPAFAPNCEYRGSALVEPSLDICGLEAVAAVVDVSRNSVPFLVRNITAEPISIPKRAELGELEVGFAEHPGPLTELLADLGVPQDSSPEQIDLSSSPISETDKERARAVFQKYDSLFDGHLGHSSVVTHSIDTGDHPPVGQAPRRVPPHLRDEVRRQIDELVRQGVLEESDGGGWASPICLSKKRSGAWRLCADLRRLNEVTKPSSYPIPRVDDTLDALSGSKMWCVLDMNSAYFQVSVRDEDRDKTTIVTPWSAHRFIRMPFGAKNAPSTCARLLDVVLRDLRPHCCINYFDDVIIPGSDFDDVLGKLDVVLKRLQQAGLTLNPAKCVMFQTEVTVLGRVLTPQGMQPDPGKVSQLATWPVPRTRKELSSFLGLASFLRQHVKSFAEIAAPLFSLTQKDVPFVWSEEAQSSFDALKAALSSAPVVALPRFGEDAGMFTLDCDASDVGVGAVLLQEQDGVERPIAFASRKLSKAQRNYSTTRKELLSCVLFVQHFRHYLLGRRFRIRSDHASLQWLINFRHTSGILARWFEILSEFDFQLVFRAGKEQVLADAMSRRPADRADAATQTEDECAASLSRCDGPGEAAPPSVSAPSVTGERVDSESGNTRCGASVHHIDAFSWSLSYLRQEQDRDPALSEIARHLSAGVKPRRSCVSEAARPLYKQWDRLQLLDGVLYRTYRPRAGQQETLQLIVPQQLVPGVLTSLHAGPAGGHFGSEKLQAQARTRFWWVDMGAAIDQFCKRCPRCTAHSTPVPRPRASLGELYADEPFDTISIDFLTNLPETDRGNRYLLVVCDHFTRWCEVYPLPDMKATTVATTIVSEFISRYGCPRRLHSDCAPNFVGAVMSEMCRLLQITQSKISSYHPEGNSKCERMMRTILSMLARYLDENHSEWDLHIPLLMLAYRSQIHSSLGYSPYFLMFAREPRLPAEAELDTPCVRKNKTVAEYVDTLCTGLRQAREFSLRASNQRHARNKRVYEKRLNEHEFCPGDEVLLYKNVVPAGQYYKFVRPWKPARIVKKLGAVNYRVRLHGRSKTIVVHHNRLRPAPAPLTSPAPLSQSPAGGEVNSPVPRVGAAGPVPVVTAPQSPVGGGSADSAAEVTPASVREGSQSEDGENSVEPGPGEEHLVRSPLGYPVSTPSSPARFSPRLAGIPGLPPESPRSTGTPPAGNSPNVGPRRGARDRRPPKWLSSFYF